MKIKYIVFLLAVLIPSYFVLAPKTARVPSDLRDAVGDSALDALPGSSSDMEVPAVPAPAAAPAGRTNSKSIYGSDDRQDYFEASAPMRKLSDSVVSFWSSKRVTVTGDKAKLSTVNFADAVGLCPGQKFAEQPIGAFCSGTLVGEDLIMTAGHCITDQGKCSDARIVFGYNVDVLNGAANTTVPAANVYSCKSIVSRALDTNPTPASLQANGGPGADYAIIKLDRKVTGRQPLPISRLSVPAKGDKLFVIGHPVGLPLKVAGNATVRDASPKYFFNTDLDTFGGNSGSAVFSARTNLIVGILVRGDVDFVDSPAGCKVASVVPQNGGRGEAVTKLAVVQQYIP